MAVTGNYTEGGPTASNEKLYGKGNWRLYGDATTPLLYSTNGRTWYKLTANCSPITLYNTELRIDTTTTGEVFRLPDEIIPRYSRVVESKSKDEVNTDVEQAIYPDFYKDCI